MRRIAGTVILCLLLSMYSGCRPGFLNQGRFQSEFQGEDQFLEIVFRTSGPKHPGKTDQSEIRYLKLTGKLSGEERIIHLPASDWKTLYEEGGMLLTFGAKAATGQVIFTHISHRKLKGNLTIRFVAHDPDGDFNKVTQLIEGEWTAKRKKKNRQE